MEYSPMREYCYWYIDIFKEEDKLTLEALGEIQASMLNVNQMKGVFDRLGNSYYSLNKNYKETVIPTLNNIEDYLLRNITKNKLHRLLELSSFTMGRENVLEFNQDLNQNVKNFIDLLKFVDENIASAYGKITQLKIPILTMYNVNELIMVQLAKNINNKHIQELVESLKRSLDPALRDLSMIIFERILNRVDELKEVIIRPTEDLMEEIKEFSHSLQEYEKSTIMDTNFFV